MVEKKYLLKSKLVYLLSIFVLIIIVIYPIYSSFSGLIMYKMNPSKYTVQNVTISEIARSKTGRGSNVRCYFEYEVEGIKKEGYLYYGAEGKNIGDSIKIAVDETGEYIRTDLWFNSLYFVSVITGIILLLVIIVKKEFVIKFIDSML